MMLLMNCLVHDERVAMSIEVIGGAGGGVGRRLKSAKKGKKVEQHQFYCRQ